MAFEILGFGLIFLTIVIGLFVLYIYTLVRQAKNKEWVWFVLTLLMSPVMFIYWIAKIFD